MTDLPVSDKIRPLLLRPKRARRFWAKVDKNGDCWEWHGYRDRQGYGVVRDGRRQFLAHRLVYEVEFGPIPAGLTVDHLCRNQSCVNPLHLDIVTNRENILRGSSFSARNSRKTHCKYGHLLAGDNMRWYKGERVCRECSREKYRRYYWRNREILNEKRNARR